MAKNQTTRQLTSWQITSIVIFILAGALAMAKMNGQSYQLYLSYLTKNDLNGLTVPALRGVISVSAKFVLLALLGLNVTWAVHNLKWRSYQQKNNVNGARWLGLSLSSGISAGLVGLVCGVSDLAAIKLISLMAAASMLLVWKIDKIYIKNKTDKPLMFLALAVGLLPWAYTAVLLFSSWAYGMVNLPAYSVAIVVIGALGALLPLVLLWLNQKQIDFVKDKTSLEKYYLATNTLLITALSLVLALKK